MSARAAEGNGGRGFRRAIHADQLQYRTRRPRRHPRHRPAGVGDYRLHPAHTSPARMSIVAALAVVLLHRAARGRRSYRF